MTGSKIAPRYAVGVPLILTTSPMPDIVIASAREAKSQYRDYVVANVCGTGRAAWTQDLAPQHFGPVTLYGDKTARLFVNAWEYAHVYADQMSPDGTLLDGYTDWAELGWGASRPQPHPKGAGARAVHVLWDGQLLDPVAAWWSIYFPMYRDLVKTTDSFARLQALSRSQDIVLVDDSVTAPMAEMIAAGALPLTHALVLKAMLEYGVNVTAEQVANKIDQQPRHAA